MFVDDRGAVKREREREHNPACNCRPGGGRKLGPGLARKCGPLQAATGPQMQAISDEGGGPQMQAIYRLTTGGGAGGRLVKKEQSKVPWSTPILEPLPGDYDRATLDSEGLF